MASPTLHGPMGRTETRRFTDMIDQSGGPQSCWLWLGGKKAAGYGHFAVQRNGRWTKRIAHRYAYELWVGPIPDGLEIDHRPECHNPPCVNPAHLEPVTHAENQNRMGQLIRSRTHCNQGHEYAAVGRYKDGKCSECVRIRNRRQYGGRPSASARTHCPAGHPYAGDNLRVIVYKGRTRRRCRTCDKARQREYFQRRRILEELS